MEWSGGLSSPFEQRIKLPRTLDGILKQDLREAIRSLLSDRGSFAESLHDLFAFQIPGCQLVQETGGIGALSDGQL